MLKQAEKYVPENMGEFLVSVTSWGKWRYLSRPQSQAEEILELVRFANVEAQKPLVEDELLFIAKYPQIARKLLTLTPLIGK